MKSNAELRIEKLATSKRQISKSRRRGWMMVELDGEKLVDKYTAPEALVSQAVPPASKANGRQQWSRSEAKTETKETVKLLNVQFNSHVERNCRIEMQARGFLLEGRGGKIRLVLDKARMMKGSIIDLDDMGIFSFAGGTLRMLKNGTEAKEFRIAQAAAKAKAA